MIKTAFSCLLLSTWLTQQGLGYLLDGEGNQIIPVALNLIPACKVETAGLYEKKRRYSSGAVRIKEMTRLLLKNSNDAAELKNVTVCLPSLPGSFNS